MKIKINDNCVIGTSLCVLMIFQFVMVLSWDDWTDSRKYDVNSKDGHFVFRVVNGKEASPGEVPYQIAFMIKKEKELVVHNFYAFCGGTLLTDSKIVTAAHCLAKRRVSQCTDGHIPQKELIPFYAVAGHLSSFNSKPQSDSQEGQWRRLQSAKFPRGHDFPEKDICIVIPRKPFFLNQFVKTMPIATQWKDYAIACQVSGYGRLNRTKHAQSLLIADLQLISNEKCNHMHQRDMSRYICTSDLVSDVHRGDSGGPLICKHTGDPNDKGNGVLVGVVSGKAEYKIDPSVGKNITIGGTFFTRVSSYADFIRGSNNNHVRSCSISILVISLIINTLLKLSI